MAFTGKEPPKKGSAEWRKNEKTINQNSFLRKVRDKSEGIEKSAGHYGQTHGGKGSAPRTNTSSKEWQDAYDQIDWGALRSEKKSYRVKINGRYQDEDTE